MSVLWLCESPHDRQRSSSSLNAHFSGLGVGIAAEAFITQQINTTVIEIDPVVYEYARRYFSLPEPNQLYLQDAREWVHEHASPAAEDKYDYVVHDCFSGGGVSGHLYTLQFWEELKGFVKSDGVVAVVRISS
jgi:spermidine synthase